jgi:hypothetical protein
MIWQFDHSKAVWLGGSATNWRDQSWPHQEISGQYLMRESEFLERADRTAESALVFRDIQNATNQRTFIASLIPRFPAGNKVPILSIAHPEDRLRLMAACCSFASDAALRRKMSQGTVNWFYVDEVPVPRRMTETIESLIQDIAYSLSHTHCVFAPSALRLGRPSTREAWRSSWAVTDAERLRLRSMLDAVLLKMYGLDSQDGRDLLTGCDHPQAALADRAHTSRLNPKGFWRVDRSRDPELRHTVLTLVALRDLEQIIESQGDLGSGIVGFCNQNGGKGWMLPEAVRLADHGLGVDERAIAMPGRIVAGVSSARQKSVGPGGL